MNQVDKELMQEKGILTENEKADEYEIQKAAMKEAVFFLAAKPICRGKFSPLGKLQLPQVWGFSEKIIFSTDRKAHGMGLKAI